VATLVAMGMVLLLGYVAGLAVAFWARRGRPGLLATRLHELGGRTFHRWYAANPEFAPSLHAGPRARIAREIVADPEKALAGDDVDALQRYFDDRRERLADNSG
jgi:hypothetical protein